MSTSDIAATAAGRRRKRVALVIGAGSIKCAAALGLWRVLQREGIALDLLVGCSGGSLYAGVMALGRDVDECQRLTSELWTPALTGKRDRKAILQALMPRLFGFDGTFGLVDDGPLQNNLQVLFGQHTFDEASIPLRIVATDLYNGECVTLAAGLLRQAIRASVAIPYVWRPAKVGERWLLDGCVSNPLPVDVAIREGADLILAMGFESPYPSRLRSATRLAFQINSIYTNNLYHANFSFHNLAHHAEIIPVLPDFDRPVRLFDTHLIPYVIECGERAAEEQIGYIKQVLSAEQD